MSFRNGSNWNEINELRSLVIFKKIGVSQLSAKHADRTL